MSATAALRGAVRRLARRRAVAIALVAAGTLALPGRFLFDPVLLDSLSIRVKTRLLDVGELLQPAQTGVVNPFYRPLFHLLHRWTDAITGDSHVGLRVLALLCHALAALALVRLARALRLRRPLALGGVLLFLLAPPVVGTAAWPVVAYWTLAAALTWLAAADLVEFVARGGAARALRAVGLFTVGLFSSQTGYHFVALLPVLALAPPRAGSRRARALLLWPLFAAIALAHFALFERGASGLLAAAPIERLKAALSAWPRFLEGALGGDAITGSPPIAWIALASFCAVALVALAQSIQLLPRLAALRRAGSETAQLLADLAPIVPRLSDLERAAFVNCPSTLRWAVYDAVAIRRPEEMVPLTMVTALSTRGGYFAPSAVDFTPVGKSVVVECRDGRLIERTPDRPFGERGPLPYVFLAGGVDLVPAFAPGLGGEFDRQRHIDGLLARARALEDPLDHVLVEQPLPGLVEPLPRERLEWRLEPVPVQPGRAPPEGLASVQIVARVDVERTAFLVAVTFLISEDPLRRVTADFGRIGSMIEATLDGRNAPIVPAFVHGCGVVVPAGSHEVRLRWRTSDGNGFAAASAR